MLEVIKLFVSKRFSLLAFYLFGSLYYSSISIPFLKFKFLQLPHLIFFLADHSKQLVQLGDFITSSHSVTSAATAVEVVLLLEILASLTHIQLIVEKSQGTTENEE